MNTKLQRWIRTVGLFEPRQENTNALFAADCLDTSPKRLVVLFLNLKHKCAKNTPKYTQDSQDTKEMQNTKRQPARPKAQPKPGAARTRAGPCAAPGLGRAGPFCISLVYLAYLGNIWICIYIYYIDMYIYIYILMMI